jgi:hypothetical protein
MAIYHFSAKMISRANGSSALAAAAYRSASRLHDARLDWHHDFSNKAGVVHSEVLLPNGAPEHLSDRESLWNAVEAAELRKDAQLAREIEFALPRELNQAEAIRLAREFVTDEFVSRGMIADLNVHWDHGADGEVKPHAHVMLTTREVAEDGFGAKVRDWNRAELLTHWREAWADHVNTRLAELDFDVRVDHRGRPHRGWPRRGLLPNGWSSTPPLRARTARSCSPGLRWRSMRSRTIKRPSPRVTWRCSCTGTARAKNNSIG